MPKAASQIDGPELRAVLVGTALSGREVHKLIIPGTDALALGVKCAPHEMLSAWTAARSVLDQAARWPVVVADYMGHYENGVFAGHGVFRDHSQAILAREAELSPADAVASWRRVMIDDQPANGFVDYQLSWTQQLRGTSPTREQVLASIGPDATVEQWDHYLLEWEIERFGTGAPPTGWSGALTWMEWPESYQLAVVFLPSPDSWAVPAYLGFHVAEQLPDGLAELSAIMHGWHSDYGAELVAHWGTMFQFLTAKLPSDVEQAWDLAGQQLMLGLTLNTTQRHLALELMTNNRWFLHAHP